MVIQQWHNAFKLSTRAFLSKRQFVSEWLNAFKYRLICMIRDGDSMNIHTNVEIINGGGFIKTKYVSVVRVVKGLAEFSLRTWKVG